MQTHPNTVRITGQSGRLTTTQPPADTAPVLTIDTNGLRGTFLPAFAKARHSYAYLDKAAHKAFRKCADVDKTTPEYNALNTALGCMGFRVEELARTITRHGGLLLIVDAA